MVVDDELNMRTAVDRALTNCVCLVDEIDEEIAFRVTQIESGEEALAVLDNDPVQIMLLDYKLTGISGIDVLNSLLKARRDLLVVMITAYASLETAVHATKLGAYDFLAKPFTPDELRAVVRKTAKHFVLQRQARRFAEDRRKIRFMFLSVLAHELKAPLAAVEGYLRVLEDPKIAADKQRVDHMIKRSLVRLDGMRKMIFDLLDLTRIESGQKQRVFSEVNLVSLAERAVESVSQAALKRNVTIRLGGDDEVTITGDAGELEIIFNNLLTNAVKYNVENGQVTVAFRDAGQQVEIAVTDTGIGMTESEMKRLFTEFSRIKNEKTRKIEGSGLGLSIVRRLARLYDGEVNVKSTPEVGSTFTVILSKQSSPDKDLTSAAAADELLV